MWGIAGLLGRSEWLERQPGVTLYLRSGAA